MKKMASKSTQPCSYCKARATWKSNGRGSIKYACPEHMAELKAHEDAVDKLDNHMSEGDYQSWGRLF